MSCAFGRKSARNASAVHAIMNGQMWPVLLRSQPFAARISVEIRTMRRISVVLGLAAFVLAAANNASRAEITYPWCAQYGAGMDGGGRNCGFWTYQQCMAALS